MSDFTIRVARPQDARQLAAVYAPYVKQTAISFEITPPTATAMLRRMDDILHRYPYLVAEQDGRVLGFAYAHPFIGRAAYDWSVETTIYLAMDERHKGLGGALYRKLEDILRAQGVLNLNACIACPKGQDDEHLTYNSVDFHKHLGFAWVGLFHDSVLEGEDPRAAHHARDTDHTLPRSPQNLRSLIPSSPCTLPADTRLTPFGRVSFSLTKHDA